MSFEELDLSEAKKLLQRPQLCLFLQTEWGSQSEGYRQKIWSDISSNKFDKLQVSISHSQNLGGYLADPSISTSPNDTVINAIGFDVELSARVRPEFARRVSATPEETSIAPSPASLWTAKEACFKALRGSSQPQVLSQIEVGNWKVLSSHLETVELISCLNEKVSSSGFGVVIHQDLYTFCFFSLRS